LAVLLRLAELRLLLGSEPESLDTARRALALARDLVDVPAQIHAWTEIGDAAFFLAEPRNALDAFEQAWALAREEPALPHRDAAKMLSNIGLAQAALGRRDLAMIELERALEVYPDWRGDELGITILGNLGSIYDRL
jgi:tetratricopeptide (TPR) repeat protein